MSGTRYKRRRSSEWPCSGVGEEEHRSGSMSEMAIFQQSWSRMGKWSRSRRTAWRSRKTLPNIYNAIRKSICSMKCRCFFKSGYLLMTGQFQTSQPEVAIVLHNAIMESFVLHLRNLLDFFYTPPRKTDVSATLFYDSGHLPPDFPPESAILSTAHRRAHKEMSHITT